MTMATGTKNTPIITVPNLSALGHSLTNFPVVALDLPPTVGVDGLIGLDFLKDKKLTIDFRQQLLELD